MSSRRFKVGSALMDLPAFLGRAVTQLLWQGWRVSARLAESKSDQ